ncbi:MAG: diguanylate cyclase [Treponema sp.]|jgi:diguanylate cyclase (GGDEF)-like protein|nr:diguanylate cyclase [Treponema sp.]
MQFAENKQIRLQNRLAREIDLTVMLAESPLIRHFFLKPDDPILSRIGIEEILAYGKAFSSGIVSWGTDIDGRYYEGDTYLTTYDPENVYHQWYPAARDQKERFSLNIDYEYLVANTTYLYINAPVREFETDGGRGIGVVGNRIRLDTFLSFLYDTDSIPIANTELYLFNNKGEITGARDSALVNGKTAPAPGAKDGAMLIEKTLIADHFGEVGKKIVSEAQHLEYDAHFFFIENDTQYMILHISSLNWYMLVVRPIAFSLFLGNPVTIVFAVMMGVILLIFVVFNGYIFNLVEPLLNFTGIMDTILSITPNLITLIDKNHRVVYMGKALGNMTTLKHPKACEGKQLLDLFDNEEVKAMIGDVVQQSGYSEIIRKATINGKRTFFKVMADDITASVQGRFILITDITAMMIYGLTDPLTGLANRRNFEQCLNDEWKRAIREQEPISFLMMDLDLFKRYNDTYGHPQGDLLLKTLAGIFAGAAKRPADLAVRMGGEEFALLLPNTKHAGALEVAECIRSAVEKTMIPLVGREELTSITISIGVACMLPSTQEKAEELILHADRCLYEAKRQGRNCIVSLPQQG